MVAVLGRAVFGMLIGGVIGFIVHRVRSAAGASCPIACNPYISVATGTVMGLLISLARAGKQTS